MRILQILVAVILCAAEMLSRAAAPMPDSPRRLGVRGGQFTLNGQPRFLLGFSYYGALGAQQDAVRKDLDDAQRLGFNWLRIWATWNAFGEDASAVGTNGAAREPFLGKLKWLVTECDRRGLVVDVTLTRGEALRRFDLWKGQLFDQLDAVEQRVVQQAATGRTSWREAR